MGLCGGTVALDFQVRGPNRWGENGGEIFPPKIFVPGCSRNVRRIFVEKIHGGRGRCRASFSSDGFQNFIQEMELWGVEFWVKTPVFVIMYTLWINVSLYRLMTETHTKRLWIGLLKPYLSLRHHFAISPTADPPGGLEINAQSSFGEYAHIRKLFSNQRLQLLTN
jgi:hypothetical protein